MKFKKYLFKNALTVNYLVTAFEFEFEKDYKFSGERHDFWEIVYVKSGKVGITAEDKVLTLSEGNMIFHKPNEFHNIWSCGNTKPSGIVMTFDIEGKGAFAFEGMIKKLNATEKKLMAEIVQHVNNVFSDFVIDEEHTEYVEQHDIPYGEHQLIKNKLETFLINVYTSSDKSEPRLLENSKSAVMYNEAVRFLEKNLYNDICVEDVCNGIGVSRSNLKKLFKKYAGMGIMKYYMIMKIDRACRMLESKMTVSDVSDALAFSSQYYFSSAFKREKGMSPMQYKKKYLEHISGK